jgi:hypothetical protein
MWARVRITGSRIAIGDRISPKADMAMFFRILMPLYMNFHRIAVFVDEGQTNGIWLWNIWVK